MLTHQIAKKITAVDAANALIEEHVMDVMNPQHVAKVPVQDRGKTRFNLIVNVAEELVITLGVDNVNHYSIAKKARIPASSVYQYFPSMAALFGVMAERHYKAAFFKTPEIIENMEVRSWRDLAPVIVDSAFDFYTQDKISELLFLNVYQAGGVREYSALRLSRLGVWFKQYFLLLYKKGDIEGLEEKLSLCLDLTKTTFIRSLSLHGEITQYYKQEATTIVLAYLSEFFRLIDNDT